MALALYQHRFRPLNDSLSMSLIIVSIDSTTQINSSNNGGASGYCAEWAWDNDARFNGYTHIIPLWARKSGYTYIGTVAVEGSTIRLYTQVPLSNVSVGVLALKF